MHTRSATGPQAGSVPTCGFMDGCCCPCSGLDLDGSSVVDLGDLLIVLYFWDWPYGADYALQLLLAILAHWGCSCV